MGNNGRKYVATAPDSLSGIPACRSIVSSCMVQIQRGTMAKATLLPRQDTQVSLDLFPQRPNESGTGPLTSLQVLNLPLIRVSEQPGTRGQVSQELAFGFRDILVSSN